MKLRDKSCHCGWKFPGFHICVDLSTPEPKIQSKKMRKMSTATYKALREAQENRRERERVEHVARDKEIVRLYNQGGVGYRELMEKFGIGQTTVQNIMKRAEAEGLVIIRKQGHNISRGA